MGRNKKSGQAPGKRSKELPQLRRGMPALDNVQKVVDFKSGHYTGQILEPNETDAYDEPKTRKKRGKR